MAAIGCETKPIPVKLFGFNISDGNNVESTTTVGRSDDGLASKGNRQPQKYECQYCCREFANSQALGGHQNAHKKERQLMKRAQLMEAATRDRSLPSPYMLAPSLFGASQQAFSAPTAAWFHTPQSNEPQGLRRSALLGGRAYLSRASTVPGTGWCGAFDVDQIAAFRAFTMSYDKGSGLDLQLGLGPLEPAQP